MFRNYFKTAWRNISKNKVFSVINVFGLSVGLACCLLMGLFIQHELSYDKFNAHASAIFRIISEPAGSGERPTLAVTPAPWAPLLKKDYPAIENYVRLLKDEKNVVGQPGGQHYNEAELLYADSTFFDVFSFGLVRGEPKRALDGPNSVVLTEDAARKYFGTADPIGKTLEINSFGRSLTVEVTGIAKNPPSASHFTFNALVSLQTLGDLSGLWSFHMFQSYVLLNDKASKGDLEKKFPGFVEKYVAGNPQADGRHVLHLQPLTDIHLHSQLTGEIGINGDVTYVYVFTGVALFVLLIACFNFTNLSTARSLARAKEVGLRKVVGAERKQLLGQFLGEAGLFAFLALVVAVGLTALALPFFNQLSGRELRLHPGHDFAAAGWFVLLVLFVGLLAGLYPAVVLSSFKPVDVLKGRFQKSGTGVSFRTLLVTLQFVISVALIASTVMVTRQLQYMKNKKLGFDKENVLVVSLPGNPDSATLETLKASLRNAPAVTSATAASSLPGKNIPVNLVNDGNTDLSKALSMQMLFTDDDFVRTLNMKLVAGSDFSPAFATGRSEGFILNEEAVKKLGWRSPAEAVGKKFQWVQPDAVLKAGKILGVVENFNITPLKMPVQPLVMHYFPMRFQYLYVRLSGANTTDAVAGVEKSFKRVYPNQAFAYSFLDDTLNNLYASEERLGSIFRSFSGLAVLIACLGILGLSLYSIQQRVREIGIRKVLGAGVLSIASELVRDFLKPVFVATLIATPLAWYAMSKWLEDFAYRVNISWWVFLSAGAFVTVVALLALGTQAVKAALADPVKNLRSE